MEKDVCYISRFTVMMCVSVAVVGGKIEIFVRETSQPSALHFPSVVFAFQARTIATFSTIATVLGVRESFLVMGVSFLFPFE